MTLSLRVLNAQLALSLIDLGTWFTSQSLSLLVTCDLFLRISCHSNISISCELGCSSCLSNSGCLGLPSLNLTEVGGGGGGLVGLEGLVLGLKLF